MSRTEGQGNTADDRSSLLAWLGESGRLYTEPSWQRLAAALKAPGEDGSEAPLQAEPVPSVLVSPEPAPAPPGENRREWYEDPERVSLEQSVLSELMVPAPGSPGLFSVSGEDGRLWAAGLVEVAGGCWVFLEMEFSDDYPSSPPRAFFRGNGLGDLSSGLRGDGSVPVPSGGEHWAPSLNSGFVAVWAIEWLENTVSVLPGGGLEFETVPEEVNP